MPDFLAAEALRAGRLGLFDPARTGSGRVCRPCHKEARVGDPVVHAFARRVRRRIVGVPLAAPRPRRATA